MAIGLFYESGGAGTAAAGAGTFGSNNEEQPSRNIHEVSAEIGSRNTVNSAAARARSEIVILSDSSEEEAEEAEAVAAQRFRRPINEEDVIFNSSKSTF